MVLKVRYFATRVLVVVARGLAMAVGQARAADDQDSAAEKEPKLIGVLRRTRPPAEKAMACKQLAIYGTKDAVPALAALLPDEHLPPGRGSRLEAIPDPAADDALRTAAGQIAGKAAGRGDQFDRRPPRRQGGRCAGGRLKDADAEVASAAAVALGQHRRRTGRQGIGAIAGRRAGRRSHGGRRRLHPLSRKGSWPTAIATRP